MIPGGSLKNSITMTQKENSLRKTNRELFISSDDEPTPSSAKTVFEDKDEKYVSAEFVAYPRSEVKKAKPTPRAIISKKRPSMEAVIGEDERELVIPEDFPFTAICALRIKTRTGATYIGTGYFVSPRVILTAGHCVYIHSAGGWAEAIEVSPARNGKDTPFGTVVAKKFYALDAWRKKQDSNSDFGIIVLPEGSSLGTRTGYFECKTLRCNADYKKHLLHISGYPGDKGGKQQWYMSGMGECQGPLLKYDIDTMGGQSGSPVWISIDNRHYAVGVHTMGNPTMGNFATRINRTIMRVVNAIKKANP